MKIVLPFIAVFLLISCNKQDQLTRTEKRLLGKWFYTNVDFKPLWGIKKDITSDYFGQTLSFENNFFMSLENTQTNELFEGVWQVNEQLVTNNQNGTINQQVIASYAHPTTGEITQLVWDSFTVYRNKIVANYSTKDGSYSLELKKF